MLTLVRANVELNGICMFDILAKEYRYQRSCYINISQGAKIANKGDETEEKNYVNSTSIKY